MFIVGYWMLLSLKDHNGVWIVKRKPLAEFILVCDCDISNSACLAVRNNKFGIFFLSFLLLLTNEGARQEQASTTAHSGQQTGQERHLL